MEETQKYIFNPGCTHPALYKYTALTLIVVQYSALALAMRYSRIVSEDLYIPSTAVVLAECMKLVLATAVVLWEALLLTAQEETVRKFLSKLHREMISRPHDFLKLLVPAGLYTIQNNLAYVAVSNLDAASYQVLYQVKILTTATCSVLLLRRQLSCFQWISLVVLIAGDSLVQLSGLQDSRSISQNNFLGFTSVLSACCSSGFAGVYFEHVLKGSNVSVWVRNVELALIGISVSLIGVYHVDGRTVTDLGFFHGYTSMVWGVISLQAVGGIIVAIVIKLAENLVKGFATSISIVLSCIATTLFLSEGKLSSTFLMGTTLVLMATIMYSVPLTTTYTWLSLSTSVKTTPEDQQALLVTAEFCEDEVSAASCGDGCADVQMGNPCKNGCDDST